MVSAGSRLAVMPRRSAASAGSVPRILISTLLLMVRRLPRAGVSLLRPAGMKRAHPTRAQASADTLTEGALDGQRRAGDRQELVVVRRPRRDLPRHRRAGDRVAGV